MSVPYKPAGYSSVTPYLLVERIEPVIQFLRDAFRGEVLESMPGPDGDLAHAEIRIGDSMVMMGKASGKWTPMPCAIYLYLPDTDSAFDAALSAGATPIMEPADMFYGDRNAGVTDSAGNMWWIATHIEDVPADELKKRNDARNGK